LIMLIYAVLVARVPRLRVRLDQAGDNAYYLGLLFTLLAMAFALFEFGAATGSTEGQSQSQSGAQQIISNFGIALASTIMGIFLRVTLHQMRIDPADVESMTRIELAEATKKVRASLDNVSGDLGRFHDEVRQRCGDTVTKLLKETVDLVSRLNEDHERTTGELRDVVYKAQHDALAKTEELTRLLSVTATEASGAVERLRAVEPPPLTLSRRLDKIGKTLESVEGAAERIVIHLEKSAEAAASALTEIAKVSNSFGEAARLTEQSHAKVNHMMLNSAEKVGSALDAVAEGVERDRKLMVLLEEQSIRSVEEAARAQSSAVEVLKRLVEVTRGLAGALKETKPGSA